MTMSSDLLNAFRASVACLVMLEALARASIDDSFRIGGLLTDSGFEKVNVNATTPFLTDLVLSSVSPSGADAALTSCCLEPSHFEKAMQARSFKSEIHPSSPSLNLWLAVGGPGNRSLGFLDQLEALTATIEETVAEYELDGVDLDCEVFPHTNDYKRYVNWMREATDTLQKNGLLVSVSLHAGQFLPSDLYERMDRVNLLAFDMPGQYHASMPSVEYAVTQLVQSGCPRDSIMLGIPTYARSQESMDDTIAFAEMVDRRGFDRSPSGSIYQFDTFEQYEAYRADSPEHVRSKVAYARETRLRGVFLSDLGKDKQLDDVEGGILLEAASGRIFSESTNQQTAGKISSEAE